MPTVPTESSTSIFSFVWDHADWAFRLSINFWAIIFFAFALLIVIIWRWRNEGFNFKDFEIDEAEFGIGSGKFRLKPNSTDRQIAYSIWVELSTRKIGLPIDLEHDVIVEIYDSWYTFFSVTRELIKSVRVTQINRESTQKIIRLSVEVLNEGLRPHLTRWQARYRAWYERELKKYQEATDRQVLDPQQIQAAFPQFAELKEDMLRVNDALIRYRSKMRQLVMNN